MRALAANVPTGRITNEISNAEFLKQDFSFFVRYLRDLVLRKVEQFCAAVTLV